MQDGRVRVWDPRDRSCVHKADVHVTLEGRGAVNSLAGSASQAAAGMLVSSGADRTLAVCDPRMCVLCCLLARTQYDNMHTTCQTAHRN
jgi:hypothetical protein